MWSRVIVRVCTFLCWLGLIGLLSLTLLPPTKAPTRSRPSEPLWYEVCTKFYEEAAALIWDMADQEKVSSVCLLPIVNQANYVCSSPCNEGLALELQRKGRAAGTTVEPVWWDDYLLTAFYTRGLFVVIPATKAVFGGGRWWKGARDGIPPSEAEVASAQTNALVAQIVISSILVRKETSTFTAEFALKVHSNGGAQRTFGPRTYAGNTRQLWWFLRRNASYPRVIPFAGMIALVLMFWLLVRRNVVRVIPEERVMGWICIVAGALLCCGVLYGLRFHRREACYFKPNNLFLLVDRNSELLFDRSGERNPNASVGPDFVIEKTCQAVLKSLGGEVYDRREGSFLRWLRSEMLQCLYEPPKYELNQRWNPQLYFCSGREEDATMCPGISTPCPLTELSRFTTMPRSCYREGRLVSPAAEVRKLATLAGIPEGPPLVVLLFTSACAPYEQEVSGYLRGLREWARTNRAVGRVAVFTVLLPTLPRTGSEELYHFEEGKLLLAILGADVLVHTNATNYDLPAIWQTMAQQSYAKGLLVDDASSPQARRPVPYIQVPIYHRPQLGWSSREEWDVPCDLERRRADLLAIEDPNAAERQCDQIAGQFVDFAKGRMSKEQESEHLVHVLEANRSDMILLLLVVGAFGFLVFPSQYNEVFLDRYLQEPRLRRSDRLCVLLSGVFLVLFFLWSMWRWHGTVSWAFRGWSDLAFLSAVSLWLALFAAPFVIFRLHCWSHWFRGRGDWRYRYVQGSVAVLIACSVGIVFSLNAFTDIRTVRFLAAFAAWPAVALVGLPELARARRPCVPPAHGPLEVWRYPAVACLIKCLLIVLVMQVIRGAVGAHGGGGESLAIWAFIACLLMGSLIIFAPRLTLVV